MHLRRNTPSEKSNGTLVSTPGSPLGVFVNLDLGQFNSYTCRQATYIPLTLPLSALERPNCLPFGSLNLYKSELFVYPILKRCIPIRAVVGGEDGKCPVDEASPYCFDVFLVTPQWWGAYELCTTKVLLFQSRLSK